MWVHCGPPTPKFQWLLSAFCGPSNRRRKCVTKRLRPREEFGNPPDETCGSIAIDLISEQNAFFHWRWAQCKCGGIFSDLPFFPEMQQCRADGTLISARLNNRAVSTFMQLACVRNRGAPDHPGSHTTPPDSLDRDSARNRCFPA